MPSPSPSSFGYQQQRGAALCAHSHPRDHRGIGSTRELPGMGEKKTKKKTPQLKNPKCTQKCPCLREPKGPNPAPACCQSPCSTEKGCCSAFERSPFTSGLFFSLFLQLQGQVSAVQPVSVKIFIIWKTGITKEAAVHSVSITAGCYESHKAERGKSQKMKPTTPAK